MIAIKYYIVNVSYQYDLLVIYMENLKVSV